MTTVQDLVKATRELRDDEVAVRIVHLDLGRTEITLVASRDEETAPDATASPTSKVSIVVDVNAANAYVAAKTADWLKGVLEQWHAGVIA